MILTVPFASPQNAVREFLTRQKEWLQSAISRMMQYKALPVKGRRDYLKYKEEARMFVRRRVEYWNQLYGFKHGRISIKNTFRTWGSCSRRGNLNFSYSLLFLPQGIADYVVVHELCHLAHPNHSPAFWAEIAKTIPDFKECRQELRRYVPH